MKKRITIIGGGASGTLLAVNLLRNAGNEPLEINLIEKNARFGRGVAFGTTHESHLLNVPAGKMGAFPDDLEHFHRWLTARGLIFDSHAFVPRKLFGEYIRDVFDEASRYRPENLTINRIDDEAAGAEETAEGVVVTLNSGGKVASNIAVLAFGNFDPPHPNVSDLGFTATKKYFRDPWRSHLYETIEPDDSIFVIGTGLSMVDLAMHFHKHRHRGKIIALSTRGLLPAEHQFGHSYPSFYDELKPMRRITELLKAVRRHVAVADSTGSNWRAVIDSLRPVTQPIWLNLPVAEKRHFMQHLSRYWNVARHRMPAEAASVLNGMKRNGTLEIRSGRIKHITFDEADQFQIHYSSVGVEHKVISDALVNCIGAESNFTKIDSALIQNMLGFGLIRNDNLSLGIDATPDGRVIGADGQPSDHIFTLGTALKGILWESTAIPEIRLQAHALALKLLAI